MIKVSINPKIKNKRALVFWFFCFFCVMSFTAWVYLPGVQGPMLLDDHSSVTKIGDLTDSPELAVDYIFGDRSGVMGRSVSMATFVLERMVSDRGMPLTKAVNIALHLFNGGLIVALLWQLFRFAGFPGFHWLSLVLGAIWLLHPLLISTVLYAVQRMAMLATTFMLLGCLSYVSWRLKLIEEKFSWWRFGLLPMCLLLGLFSKENAILLIPVVLLLEVLWFQFAGPNGKSIPALRNLSCSLIVIGLLGAVTAVLLRWEWWQAKFRWRPFTLEERLLTESRILWDYVAQWYIPDVSTMGIYHDDILLSRSFLEPISTLYSSVAWLLVGIFCLALCFTRLGRYLAFAILVYLVGHSIESTIWPLELYFEHRNYFSSLGLLLILGVLVGLVARKEPKVGPPLTVGLAFFAIMLCMQTSSQVTIWSSRPLFVLANVNGHPNSPRANIDMAVQLARFGDSNTAHEYSKRAFEASSIERKGEYLLRNVSLSCIAGEAVDRRQVDQIGALGEYRPFGSVTTLLIFARLVQNGSCKIDDAMYTADHLERLFFGGDSKYTTSAKNYSNLAVLENSLGRYENALIYIQKYLEKVPNNSRGLLMELHFAVSLEKEDIAEKAIQKLNELMDQGKLSVQEQQTLAMYVRS